ncbi:MAG: substrate-binding domain-containing protein [Chloroflexi bacterium]|nr:substrate-binding domain-containing protein [Chloroflexota bacterium]
MRRLYRLSPLRSRQFAIAIALMLTLGAGLTSFSLLNDAHAHPGSEDPTVRVSALKSDDGTVRVSVQRLGADGEWGERQFPTRRVVSTDAPTGTWLPSSPVDVASGQPDPLFCVVAHGAPDDRFWVKFRAYLFQSAALTDTNLRFETHLDGADQAAALERCLADGAAVVASTLASPDDVKETLLKAREMEVRVVTFNAGVEHAEDVGSQVHIALNDRAAGELAGRQFNERGISGQVGCLIHERDNLSLEHRCDGLEATYAGAGVTRIQLEEVASHRQHDPTAHDLFIQTIANEFIDQGRSRYDAVLTLSADSMEHALRAVERLEGGAGDLRLASVGASREDLAAFPDALLEQHLDVLISDSVDTQGFFVASAMHLSYKLHHAVYINQPQLWLADPSLAGMDTAGENAQAVAAASASLDRLIAESMVSEPEDHAANVRVAALKRADGSIVFAIQSMDADGGWNQRQLPQLRVLAADAPSGIWHLSSGVELPAEEEPEGPLFCVVAHGSKADRYWQVARAYMHVSAHLADANYRFESHLDGADQAAAIDQCSADGAAVIASTLADPDAVTDSLLAAKAAGARIVTFNSGASFAAAAGSEIHVALDDREAGVRAAQRISALGVTGPIVCVMHEQGNVGLEERCEGLEATYQGESVRRLHLTEGASDEEVVEELIAKLTDPEWADVQMAMTLNANTLFNALKAFDRIYADSGHTIRILPIGSHVDLRLTDLAARQRHMASLFNDSVESQGFLVLSAMLFVQNSHTPPELIGSPQLWLATPFALNASRAQQDVARTRMFVQTLLRYVAEAAADDE